MPCIGKAEMLFGGYVPANGNSSDITSMAKSAIELKNIFAEGGRVTLVRIKHSEVQRVSGKNFRFCLRVKQGKHRFNAKAIVYRDLTGRMMLTQWKPDGC